MHAEAERLAAESADPDEIRERGELMQSGILVGFLPPIPSTAG
jgi:hypothetical protein